MRRLHAETEVHQPAKELDRPGPSGKRQCVIFTAADGGDDRACMQEIEQEAKRGFRAEPLATVALYGPDHNGDQAHGRHLPGEDAEAPTFDAGLRSTRPTPATISGGGRSAGVHHRGRSQVGCQGRRMIGRPHEEGIDYEGATCPVCRFWAGRDRWTGKRLH